MARHQIFPVGGGPQVGRGGRFQRRRRAGSGLRTFVDFKQRIGPDGHGNGQLWSGGRILPSERVPGRSRWAISTATGAQDLATANWSSNNVSVLTGTGTGSFGAASNFPVGSYPISVAVGDFNGDGVQDLATANFASNNVSVLTGTGTGSFGAASNFSVGSSPISVAVGDFNGDGVQDLATANFNSNNVSVLIGYGNGRHEGVASNLAWDRVLFLSRWAILTPTA